MSEEQTENHGSTVCPECGNEVPERSGVCQYCGSPGCVDDGNRVPSKLSWYSLDSDEEVIWSGSPSWFSYSDQLGVIIFLYYVSAMPVYPAEAALLNGVLFVAASLWLLGILVHRSRRRFALTSTRVIGRTDFPEETVTQSRLENIEGVRFEQDVLGKWFNYGTMILDAAQGQDRVIWRGVSSPDRIQELVLKKLN